MDALRMRLSLSSELLFGQFGQHDAIEPDAAIIEAAAAVARERYAGAPWEAERTSDASVAAIEAAASYKPEDGRSVIHTKANYVLGQASGLTRNAATTESEAEAFVRSFSDLIPEDIEDAEEYLEGLLGTRAVYSPASDRGLYDEEKVWDADNAVFYTSEGVLELRQVAERIAHSAVTQELLAEMFLSEDFTAIEDLTDAIHDRLKTWAASNDIVVDLEPEEPEPEFCPLDWVWVAPIVNGKPDWSKGYPDLRRGMECSASGYAKPDDDNDDPDLIYEEWAEEQDEAKGIFDDGYSGAWCEQIAPSMPWTAYYEYGHTKRAKDGKHADDDWQILDWRDYVGDLVRVISNERKALPKEQRKGLTIDNLLTAEEIELLVQPAVEYMITLGEETMIEDVSINAALNAFAFMVSERAKVKGTYAAIAKAVDIDLDLRNEDIDPVELSTNNLRQLIIKAVDNGEMFASRALVVLAKLDGLTNQQAEALANQAYELSVERKAIFGQKRFSIEAEKLLTNKIYPRAFGYPLKLVAVIGDVPVETVRHMTSKLGEYAIVGYEQHAEEVAQELGVRYIAIPVAGDKAWVPQMWARGQCLAVATHVLATVPEKAEGAFKHWLSKTGAKSVYQVE